MNKTRVVVGLSGGVDSSVAAYLLKEKGYEVIGVTMEMWGNKGESDGEKKPDLVKQAGEDAKKVADALGISHYIIDFRDTFKENVIDDFVNEYMAGRTPNPCLVCNRRVKWQALLEKAKEFGAEYIATGHYSRIDRLENGRYALRRSITDAKDQTYALYRLTQEQLEHTMMPVGEYTKDEIREIAEKIGLEVASKAESMEICFIPDNDYAGFIEKYGNVKIEPGNFVDINGNVIGTHKGIIHYTIGQRKGLNLSMGYPVFVVGIRPDTNEVVIGGADDVFTDRLIATKVNHMSEKRFDENKQYIGKIRYNHKGTACKVRYIDEETIECIFEEKVRAVTPGQALVLYDGEYVAGGGIIKQ